jgi:hypothetical protein
MLAELEQDQLGGRLLGLRPTDHDEAAGTEPAGELVAKLGHLEALAGTDVRGVDDLALDRRGRTSDDHKVVPLRFQPFDQGMVVKPFMGPDQHRPDPGRNLRETRLGKVARPGGGMGTAWPQFPQKSLLWPSKQSNRWYDGRPRLRRLQSTCARSRVP